VSEEIDAMEWMQCERDGWESLMRESGGMQCVISCIVMVACLYAKRSRCIEGFFNHGEPVHVTSYHLWSHQHLR
jgi:hypothetical protein